MPEPGWVLYKDYPVQYPQSLLPFSLPASLLLSFPSYLPPILLFSIINAVTTLTRFSREKKIHICHHQMWPPRVWLSEDCPCLHFDIPGQYQAQVGAWFITLNCIILTNQTGFIHQGSHLVLHPVLLLLNQHLGEFSLCLFFLLVQAPTCPGKLALPAIYKVFLSLAAAWSEMKAFHTSRPWDKARFFLRTSRKPVGLLVGEGGAHTPEGPWRELALWNYPVCPQPAPPAAATSPLLTCQPNSGSCREVCCQVWPSYSRFKLTPKLRLPPDLKQVSCPGLRLLVWLRFPSDQSWWGPVWRSQCGQGWEQGLRFPHAASFAGSS